MMQTQQQPMDQALQQPQHQMAQEPQMQQANASLALPAPQAQDGQQMQSAQQHGLQQTSEAAATDRATTHGIHAASATLPQADVAQMPGQLQNGTAAQPAQAQQAPEAAPQAQEVVQAGQPPCVNGEVFGTSPSQGAIGTSLGDQKLPPEDVAPPIQAQC
jgi:hypothetical protein